MRLTVGSGTDVGLLRTLNEDSVLVAEDLFAVADGMGGHQGGEVASARALIAFQAAAADRTLDTLMASVQAANGDVYDHARTSPELVGMGTTLCALAALDDHRVAVVNVGDSRVYLLRAGDLFQVSEDHSFVETLVREGRLTRAQADVHPQRNVITRALGIEPYIDVDGWEVAVRNGDRFLLCSDGLFNDLSDSVLLDILIDQAEPASAAGRLIDAANAAGGRDNISCIVIDVDDVDPSLVVPETLDHPIAASLTKRSTAADLDETTIDEPTVERTTTATPTPAPTASPTPSAPKPKRFTWRTALFLLAILAVFGVALVATDVVYRNEYTVTAEGNDVVIVKGPIDGFLWISPEVTTTDVSIRDLNQAQRAQVRGGVSVDSATQARNYVSRLVPPTSTTTTTTTTSTTTTSTAAPDPTAAPPG